MLVVAQSGFCARCHALEKRLIADSTSSDRVATDSMRTTTYKRFCSSAFDDSTGKAALEQPAGERSRALVALAFGFPMSCCALERCSVCDSTPLKRVAAMALAYTRVQTHLRQHPSTPSVTRR